MAQQRISIGAGERKNFAKGVQKRAGENAEIEFLIGQKRFSRNAERAGQRKLAWEGVEPGGPIAVGEKGTGFSTKRLIPGKKSNGGKVKRENETLAGTVSTQLRDGDHWNPLGRTVRVGRGGTQTNKHIAQPFGEWGGRNYWDCPSHEGGGNEKRRREKTKKNTLLQGRIAYKKRIF